MTLLHSNQPEVLVIRPIEPRYNAEVKSLVVATLEEFGCVGPGFASSDPELEDLYSVYHVPEGETPDRAYWVIYDRVGDRVLGGGGFSRLKCTTVDEGICELQKVYFSPELRGKGFGGKLLLRCIEEAKQAGYREMYLETMPQMASAVGMYEKFGFRMLPTYKGDTGHRSCTVFMSRLL